MRDHLTTAQIKQLTKKSDLRGAVILLSCWLGVALIFYITTQWPHPLILLLALPLLAGRQLALSVVMHECGHNTLFRTRSLNQFCGQYLAGQPTLGDLHSYAASHTHHHRLAGTSDDPDLTNYKAYPISRESFRRKIWRDLSGQTGYKLISFVVIAAAGVFSRDTERRKASKPFAAIVLNNALFAWLLAVLFSPWAYLLWLLSIMTFFMLIVRVRQIAEHAHVLNPISDDPREHTRTILVPWWQRLFLAPNFVNYHMEHHFMAGVPCYRLPTLHALLKSSGALHAAPPFRGYGEVLNRVLLPQ